MKLDAPARTRTPSDRPAPAIPATAVLATAVIIIGYLVLFWSLDSMPFQDLPNHLTRAAIESDLLLHGGQRYGNQFACTPLLTPYVGGDALLAGLVTAFGAGIAGRMWVLVAAASFPVSLAIYLRAARFSPYSIFVASILSLYLTTEWFFLTGMFHFRLAVAVVLLALAAWEVWLRKRSVGAYIAWTLLVVAGYLIHLSALLFSAVAAAVIGLVAVARRETSWRRATAGTLPLATVTLWQVLAPPSDVSEGVKIWGGWRKLWAVLAPFARYEWPLDGALLLGLAGVCALLLLHGTVARSDRRVVSAVLLTIVFLALYAVIPFASGRFSHLDTRAVVLAATFAVVAALAAGEHGGVRSRAVIWLSLLVALGNLALLSAHLIGHNRVLREYRAIAARVPPDARVLPVATVPLDGFTNPFIHAGAFVTLDAGAFTPYLPTSGATRYFGYRSPPSRPVGEFWYQAAQPTAPGARAAIERDFDYLIVMNPFDPMRLPVATEVVARNEAATLLRIVPGT